MTAANLPPTYDSRAARLRVMKGLMGSGVSEALASWATTTAMAEAPFAPVTEDGWRILCRRARVLAFNRCVEKPNEVTGALNYPADGVGVPARS